MPDRVVLGCPVKAQTPLRQLSAHLRNFPDTLTVAAAFAAIGLTLLIQPERYDNTPSYQNLLDIARQPVWGAIYLAAAFVLLLSVRYTDTRIVVVVGHTAAIALTASWLAAFVVRYFSDKGTTIVNIVSWSVFLALLIRSTYLVDDASATRTRPGVRPQ